MGKSRSSSSKPNTQHTCKFISFSFLRSSIILLYFLENEEKADSIPRSQRPFISARFFSRRFFVFCSARFSLWFCIFGPAGGSPAQSPLYSTPLELHLYWFLGLSVGRYRWFEQSIGRKDEWVDENERTSRSVQ